MGIAFLLDVLIIIGSFFLFKKDKINSRFKFLILMGIGVLCLGIIVYPLLDFENSALKIANAIFFALKSITLNEELTILSEINISTCWGFAYFLLVNALLLALPILAASTLIAFINELFTDLRFKKLKNKNLYFFSDMNEKSIMIAKNYANVKNNAIIFANCESYKDNNKELSKYIKLSERINEIDFSKYNNEVTVYLISENEEHNLNNALEIMAKYKNKRLKVYTINNTKEAPTVLDSANREIIKKIKMNKNDEELLNLDISNLKIVNVELVNETERAIFNLLDKKPIYEKVVNKTISLLIVGCGQVGKEFLMDSLWCGTMIGYNFKALVIDINADKIKQSIEVESPELLNNYNITFINADIRSPKAVEAIKQENDINYILVSMETDSKNLDTAIDLRRLFIKLFERKPVINIWIQNEYKKEQINKLINEKETAYDINAFGSIKDMYFENRIVDSEIEELGEKIHKAFDGIPVDYCLNEYNKHSSRASALHVKYKLYSVLKEKYCDNLQENLKMFREIYTEELEEMLAKNEHDRWNAYMRTMGYTKATIDDVKMYYPVLKDHRDYLGRRHPALVPYEDLDNVSKELKSIGIDKNLRKSDYDIVKMMLNDF